jgi:purine-binding chemotaxis protein CheW
MESPATDIERCKSTPADGGRGDSPDRAKAGCAGPARTESTPEACPTASSPAGPVDPLDEFFYRPDEDIGALGALVEFAADLEDEPPATPEEPLREFLGFRLSGEHYAVGLAHVREIARVPPITEVPRAPASIAGVMAVRGEVMPVFDLRRRLGLPPSGEPGRDARVLVVQAGEGPMGVLVDAVEEVVRLRPSTIEAPPTGLGTGERGECIAGIGRARDRLYALLDLSVALRPEAG